ncbi:hypothetical protein ABH935_001048 [Catenulispora sp. GAS73]
MVRSDTTNHVAGHAGPSLPEAAETTAGRAQRLGKLILAG